MWKYISAFFLCTIGVTEVVLALNGRLRDALMRSSPVRSKRAEVSTLLVAGLSALVMGLGILFYGLFW